MTFWVAGAVVVSSAIGSSAAKGAAKTQSAAADRAAELQNEQFQQTRQDYAPYREAGYNALAELQRTAGNVPGAFKFGAGDYQADPGYAFRLSEGQKALDRQAAARGGLISGGALKAAQRYGQEMGSQEFTNAFNRYQTNRANQLQPLQSLMGAGQTAANTMGGAAANYGTNAGNLITSGGAARASGYVGGANALTSGLGQYMNYTQNQNLMNRLLPTAGGSTATPYSPLYQSQMPGAGV